MQSARFLLCNGLDQKPFYHGSTNILAIFWPYWFACRSYKSSHLAQNNWVEICNWNAASQQQFRLRGSVTIVNADSNHEAFQSLRQQEYKRLETPSVLQWYHNADRAPGKPFQSPVQKKTDQQVLALANVSAKSQLFQPLSAFAVLMPKAPLPSTMLILSCIQLRLQIDWLQHTGEQGLS